MRTLLKSFAIAACLSGSAAVAQESTVELSLEDARVLATRALFGGQPELALQLANGLLQANPDDRGALVIIAAAAPRVGKAAEGQRAGARAYRLSETDDQRYEAARLTALAAANGERFTYATFWLRRALTVVPNDAERKKTLNDARRLKQLNPWSTNLGFSVVPSNNVNGGADENDVDDLGGLRGTLSADALALEGIRATLNFSTRYRLYQSPKAQVTGTFRYQAARIKLRDEVVPNPAYRPDRPVSPTNSPMVRLDPDDFSSDYVEASIGYDRALKKGTAGIRLTAGSFTFGEDPYYDFQRISLHRAFPLSDRMALRLSALRERRDFDNSRTGEATLTTLRTGLSYGRANGDRVDGSFSVSRSDSDRDNPGQTYENWSLQANYSWAEPIGPFSLGANLGVKQAFYPIPTFFNQSGDRQDDTVFYGVNIGLPDVSYAGFSPALSITGNRTDSNVGRYSRNTTSVALTINSSF